MQKILITGANGQLGNQIKYLSNIFEDVDFLFTDLPELDITNEVMLEQVMESFNPEWVINCAAYTAVDKAESEPALAELINTTAPALLAKVTDRHHARLIHISTDYVFDGTGHKPYAENHPKNPQGTYAQTKALGEDMVLANNPRSVIIRTSWLYSTYGNNFVKTILRLAKDKKSINIVSDQVGTPTFTGDLAFAIFLMIEIGIQPGIYHYSNEGVCSWYDFAKAIVEIEGLECRVEPITSAEYPLPAPRPFYSVLDKSLYKKITGIAIPYWRDSLKVCLKMMHNQE